MPLVAALVLSAVIGYLLGAISPAYLLGRVIQQIDIRTVNLKNAGTRNVYRTLGVWPAVVTALIDLTKGVAALLIAEALGLHGAWLVVPVFGAITGHLFPFYLGFRGGRGTATAVGVLIYVMVFQIVMARMVWHSYAVILGAAAVMFAITRSGEATGVSVFVAMVAVSVLEIGSLPYGALLFGVALFLATSVSFTAWQRGLFRLEVKRDIKAWRVLARPFALLFVVLRLSIPPLAFFSLIIALTLAALALDMYRRFARRGMATVFKEKEKRKLSSITFFLVSVVVIFLIFETSTAAVALGFLVIGDPLGKLIGMKFGKTSLLSGRTLEGSVAFLVGAFLAGYTIARALGTPPLWTVTAGAAVAMVIEAVSGKIDDNLTVGIGSAGAIALLLLL